MNNHKVQLQLQLSDGKYSIPISTVKRGEMNVFRVREMDSVIVFASKDGFKIIHDLCPHMGGPLSQGHLCKKSKALVCPWHGYLFSTDTLTLVDNPNESIWIKPLAGEQADDFKTPPFKMREIVFQEIDDHLVFSAHGV